MEFELPTELIENYLKKRQNDVTALQQALEKADIQFINKIGHQVLGNASNFGFPQLEAAARQLENLKADELKQKGAEVIKTYSDLVAEMKMPVKARF